MKRVHWHLKFIALVLAGIIWALIVTSQKSEVRTTAQIKVNLPQTHMVIKQSVSEVTVTLKVSRTVMRAYIDRNPLQVAIDIPNPVVGMMFHRIMPSNIILPKTAELIEIYPREVLLELDSVVSKSVPVKARFLDNSEKGLSVASFVVSPETVNIIGAESELKKISKLELTNISLANRENSFVEKNVRLPSPQKKYWLETPVEFSVNVVLEEGFAQKSIGNIPVDIVTANHLRSEIYPSTISSMTVYGNRHALQAISTERIKVVKDLSSYSAAQTIQTKINPVDITLPDNLKLVNFDPKNFVVKLYEKSK